MAAEDERAFVVALESLYPLLGALEEVEHPLSVLEELLAGGREAHAAPLADEELRSQLLLEVLHRYRQRRLADVERFRGGRHRAAACDGGEVAQVTEIHGPPFLSCAVSKPHASLMHPPQGPARRRDLALASITSGGRADRPSLPRER